MRKNKKIMAETKFGTFDDLLDMTPENLRPIVAELKKVILVIDPNTSCPFIRRNSFLNEKTSNPKPAPPTQPKKQNSKSNSSN